MNKNEPHLLWNTKTRHFELKQFIGIAHYNPKTIHFLHKKNLKKAFQTRGDEICKFIRKCTSEALQIKTRQRVRIYHGE